MLRKMSLDTSLLFPANCVVRLTPKFLSRLLCHLLVATPDNMKDIMIEQDVLDRIQQLLTFKHSSLYKLAKQSDIPYSSLNNIFNRQTCPTMGNFRKNMPRF